MIVTGVGGTGVVTLSAVLGQAAYLEKKGFGSIDMTGLAQKGGAVMCHVRVASSPDDIAAIRTGAGQADLILGCDMVVTASNKILEAIQPDKTAVIYSTHEMNVATFTLNPNYRLPGAAIHRAIEERVRSGPLHKVDAQHYAEELFGMNTRAFRIGRLVVHDKGKVDQLVGEKHETAATKPHTLDELVAHRKKLLTDYQDAAYAERYERLVRVAAEAERSKAAGRTGLADAVARSFYKLMAYKDEYEVGRLYSSPEFMAKLGAQFDSHARLEFHLAPPLLARRDKLTGEPRKMTFGPWMMHAFRLLARFKHLRGGRFDVFGYTAERRLERQMIVDYEVLVGELIERLKPDNHGIARELAALPLEVKGFGHVKHKAYEAAKAKEAALLSRLRSPSPATPQLHAAE